MIDRVASGLRRVPLTDIALGMAVAALIAAGTVRFAGSVGPFAAMFLAASGLALIGRRVWPVATLAVVVLCSLVGIGQGAPDGLYLLPLGLALFSATDAGHRRVALAAIAVVVGGIVLVELATDRSQVESIRSAVFSVGWLVASVVFGSETRSRRALLQAAEQRAIEAERIVEAESLRRAGEERIRIARELHDILAHRISLISVQAGAGLHLMDRQPEQARASLVAIRQASKEALDELRTTLGLLRQVEDPAPRAPAPSLALIDGLIVGARSAGVIVDVAVDGTPCELPAGVDLAAYRIVQESLTNVIRHARTDSMRIAIGYRPSELLIDIADDGVGAGGTSPSTVGGSGMTGMRERAEALGGELVVGSQAGGGFRVHARLPIASDT